MVRTFTTPLRHVVIDAVGSARAEAAHEVREEHLLVALVADPGLQPMLTALGCCEAATLLADVRQAHRRAGVTQAEAAALARLGVDVDGFVTQVEAVLGEGALDDTAGPPRTSRRRLVLSVGARGALQTARQQASARGARRLGPEHLLLGLLGRPGVVADVFGRRGATVASAIAVLDAGQQGRPTR